MTKQAIAEALNKERQGNPVWDAVAHVLAFRKRNRRTLTTKGLWLKMRKEGFNYKEGAYVPVVKFLSDLGLGKLQVTRRGRPLGLKDIKMPLQQIGTLACGGTVPEAVTPTESKPPSPVLKAVDKKKEPLVVTLSLYGCPVKVLLPHSISAYDTVRIITQLNKLSR